MNSINFDKFFIELYLALLLNSFSFQIRARTQEL
jgi:hypothetical protein